MKKLLSLTTFCLLSILLVMGCKPNVKGGVSHIYGTMESKQWDGKKIFLVPMFGPQDAAHVDSVVIKDGKFEFTADSTELKIIRLDYHSVKALRSCWLFLSQETLKCLLDAIL